jgi:hypothetical protein
MRRIACRGEESVVADTAIIATVFLLRIDEILKRRRSDVTIQERVLTLNIPFSKVDSAGRGVQRSVRCACRTDPAACAVCAAERLLGRPPSWARRPTDRLVQTEAGTTVTYDRFVTLLRRLMVTIGESKRDGNGRQRWGGHSCRRGGAQSLARSGFPLTWIQIWGRWESDCVRRYCEEASAMHVSGAIAGGMVERETALSRAWDAAAEANLTRR